MWRDRTKATANDSAPPDGVDPEFGGQNPLESDDPGVWNRLVESVGPASLLLVIDSRLGPMLRGKLNAEDVLQDALLHAWRDRASCAWTDLGGFRAWLLGIIDHRLLDARDYYSAQKRRVDREQPIQRALPGLGTWRDEPIRTTTPSRLAMHREQAEVMRASLENVPSDWRDVVRLRLFEGKSVTQVASELGIGDSAAKHRYRKGIDCYRRALHRHLRTRNTAAWDPQSRNAGIEPRDS
ncbi:MAG: sigma-70 family RNA polymerase sigma factor [Planctomycetes bacterium]|nr:sigma-70 family RNA polymerase sigma factor [Planctomycetota bacterium]MCB9892687.1 sigma-70 family RNA polymerase sigma factor [Planctomycetota bacterium]MCB9919094.1 sigma-70 family RNA polymerase sigma factor [Planctomycetota bacterium]